MKLGSLLAKSMLVMALVWVMNVESFAAFRWTGWREVPGGGFTSRPVSGVWFKAEKLLYVFHTGDDGRIYYQTTFKTFFSGWIEVPGAGATDADVSATIWTNNTADVSDDGLYLFARGTDGMIYVNTKPAFGAWSGWYSFASHPPLATGLGPVAQTDINCDEFDSLNVFFTSTGGTDWHLQYCELVGGWSLKPAPSILNVGRMGCTGINELVATGNDGIVYRNALRPTWPPDGFCDYRPGNWEALPGVYSDVPPVGAQWPSSVDACEPSEVYVCKESGTNQLYCRFSSGSPEDRSWRELPGGGRTDVAPGATAMKIGRVEVIVVMVKGTDHRIYWNIAKNRLSI